MPQPKKTLIARSYWLKCWRENASGEGEGVWRFSLEDPRTGERVGFASLRALTTFLESRTRMWSTPGESDAAEDGQPAGDAAAA